MNANEIVRALRDAENNSELDCDIYELRPVLTDAADLIESLQKENTGLKDIAGRYEQLQEKHKKLIAEADDLEIQLSASQARERAAVDELCDCCKRYARTVTLKTDCLNCQWRGPQAGEE